ncbi:hypothetical protein FJT64_016500 [Amphibalanus amphitrite]|uniref:Uncharacterized protein n=1 Tax=Amphibalanus amphitrite TaxID=1232801 RepID=A0A6A4XEA7_AMPAM|nr:hypothetical protein FJT64_016500 [Amphibalanus amphitrite]
MIRAALLLTLVGCTAGAAAAARPLIVIVPSARPHWRPGGHSGAAHWLYALRRRTLADLGRLGRHYELRYGRLGRPWAAAAAGGPSGPWAVTSDGRRHAVYAMNGVAWPARAARQWPPAHSPSHGIKHHGWGIVWTNGAHCGHGGKHQPERDQQPEREPPYPEQPEREPPYLEQPEREPPYPEQPEREPPYPEQPEREPPYPEQPEREPPYPEQPEASGLYPAELPDVAAPEEKTECAEGAVFVTGECTCPDSRPFLDTILERCVDVRPVIH